MVLYRPFQAKEANDSVTQQEIMSKTMPREPRNKRERLFKLVADKWLKDLSWTMLILQTEKQEEARGNRLLSREMSKLDLERRELARGRGDIKLYIKVFRQYMQVLLTP